MSARTKWLAFRALHGKHAEKQPHQGLYVNHIAFGLLSGAVAILCALNDAPIRIDPPMQMIAHASFIIAAACMYIVYRVVTFALQMVLSCVEHRYHNVADYDEEEVVEEKGVDEEATNDATPDNDAWKLEEATERIERVPREVVVSSMYMGGIGSFLAVAPLCMWYPPSTMAFCIALMLIAIRDEKKKIIPIFVCAGLTMGMGAMKLQVVGMWPQIAVGALSPFFIWASTGAADASPFYHRLSAPQTLETALPVSLVLAILVLCWYSPVEETISLSRFSVARLTTMMIIVPPYLSANLALLLHAFRTRKIAMAALILTFVMSVRQTLLSTPPGLMDIVAPLPVLFCIIGVLLCTP
jgi:hypothetical protein